MQPCLQIRPATPADKLPVLKFCAATWDGGDYIAAVWDAWFANERSALLVGVFDQRPVALVHIDVADGDGWLEGLRVDPSLRGRGFGRQMVQRGITVARRRGAAVLRLLSNRTNAGMMSLLAQLRFTHRFDAAWFRAAALDGSAPQVLSPQRFEEAWLTLGHAAMLAETGGVYAAGWRFVPLTSWRLRKHFEHGQVVSVPGSSGVAIVMPDGESAQPAIALAGGDVSALLHGLRAHPAAHANDGIGWLLPVERATAEQARAAGYNPRPHRFGVYALSLKPDVDRAQARP